MSKLGNSIQISDGSTHRTMRKLALRLQKLNQKQKIQRLPRPIRKKIPKLRKNRLKQNQKNQPQMLKPMVKELKKVIKAPIIRPKKNRRIHLQRVHLVSSTKGNFSGMSNTGSRQSTKLGRFMARLSLSMKLKR
jgi:hypothetical protein